MPPYLSVLPQPFLGYPCIPRVSWYSQDIWGYVCILGMFLEKVTYLIHLGLRLF